MKALVFGEILWDIIEGEHHLGGAPFNFAAHFVKCGGQATLISSIGNDDPGRRAIKRAKELGVDTSFTSIHPSSPTGVVDVHLHNGQPDYTIFENVAFDFIEQPNKLPIDEYDIFYFGTLAQRSPNNRDVLKSIIDNGRFTHVFFDLNLRKNFYTEATIINSLAACTILKLNEQEASVISLLLFKEEISFPLFCKKISERFSIGTVIITAAELGCYTAFNDTFLHCPTKPLKVLDAVGAGDAFSAAFLSIYLNTRDPLKSSEIANKIGAFVAASRGAIPDYPMDIQKLLVG